MLTGEYNSTIRDDHETGKHLKWGYKDGAADYECAICSKLRDAEVTPLRKPKRPRKKRYRKVDYQIPKFYPKWVHDLAKKKGLLQ